MKSSTNQSLKCDNNKEKSKSQYKTPTNVSNPNRGQRAYKRQVFPILLPNPLQAFKMEEHFTPLWLPIDRGKTVHEMCHFEIRN